MLNNTIVYNVCMDNIANNQDHILYANQNIDLFHKEIKRSGLEVAGILLDLHEQSDNSFKNMAEENILMLILLIKLKMLLIYILDKIIYIASNKISKPQIK